MAVLRDYQGAMVAATLAAFREYDRVLAVMPTGSGKTVCFVEIAKVCLGTGKRVLVLLHRRTLIAQAAATFEREGIRVGIEAGGTKAGLGDQVVVGSVQGFAARLARWPRDHFRLVVVDEAHHSVSEQWRTVVEWFQGIKLLGVTATPCREDGRDMGEVFEMISYEVPLFSLIDDGWLAPVSVRSLPLRIDLSAVPTARGDYALHGLDDVISPVLDRVAEEIAAHAADRRKILVFLPLRATSRKCAESLRRAGITAEHVEGGKDSVPVLRAFSRGDFRALCNASLLTEGYDEPGIDCVVPLRPTQSFCLFSQMVGRGTRIAPGKSDLLLLDFLWQVTRNRLIRPAMLFGASVEEAAEVAEGMEGVASPDLRKAIEDVVRKREERLRKELERQKAKKERVFDLRDLARWTGCPDIERLPETDDSGPPTEGQIRLLRKFHANMDQIRTKDAASRVIGRLLARGKGAR